ADPSLGEGGAESGPGRLDARDRRRALSHLRRAGRGLERGAFRHLCPRTARSDPLPRRGRRGVARDREGPDSGRTAHRGSLNPHRPLRARPGGDPARPAEFAYSLRMFTLRGVAKRYREVVALHPLDLDVARGQTLVLIGPSGSGKSTLLRLMAGLDEPSQGEVRFD